MSAHVITVLGCFAAVLLLLLVLLVWRFAVIRGGLRAVWLYGRHLLPMCVTVIRWPSLAASCGLARWKTFTRGNGDKLRQVEKAVNVPGTKGWRPTPAGYRFQVRHRHGQSIESYRAVLPELESGLKGQVRVLRAYDGKQRLRRDRCQVVVNRRDPFAKVPSPVALTSTRLRLGVVEDGHDLMLDFDKTPHLLTAGVTGSGKSGFQNALVEALAPTDAVLVMVDLKWGVTAEPVKSRASVIAETVDAAAAVFADLITLGAARARLCKAHMVDKVVDLREHLRPRPIFALVDEVAEMTFKSDAPSGARSPGGDGNNTKDASAAALAGLLRSVQLLRFADIHLVICGQRFGSALGKQITTIRAQLPGRICLRVEDRETSDMCVGDLAPEAVEAALAIGEHMPGVAVINGGPDRWQLGRFAHTTHQRLAQVCSAHADRTVPWSVLMGETASTDDTTILPVLTSVGSTSCGAGRDL